MKGCVQLLKVNDITTPDVKIAALLGPWGSTGFTYICPFSSQSDFQQSEEEKERLSAELQRLQSLACNMDDMMRKSQELCSRLSQQESGQKENLKVGGGGETTETGPSAFPRQLNAPLAVLSGEVSSSRRPADGRTGEAGGHEGGIQKGREER